MIATGDREMSAGFDELDAVLVYGFLAEAGAEGERYHLAATCAKFEAALRAAEWAALDVYLATVGPDGKVVIPDDLAEWERWASACVRLGWNHPAPPEGGANS